MYIKPIHVCAFLFKIRRVVSSLRNLFIAYLNPVSAQNTVELTYITNKSRRLPDTIILHVIILAYLLIKGLISAFNVALVEPKKSLVYLVLQI
jgi:hypothetical protein